MKINGKMNKCLYGFSKEKNELYPVMQRLLTPLLFLALTPFAQCGAQVKTDPAQNKPMEKKNPIYSKTDTAKINLPEGEWKKILSSDVFYIARMKGTERPWSSPLEKQFDIGTYYCTACGNALFKSDTKFESGCGWPSFYEPISKGSILYTPDNSHGMERTEVQCGRCKAHLGHVFEDGPPPTGLRYCINGVVLDFEKGKK